MAFDGVSQKSFTSIILGFTRSENDMFNVNLSNLVDTVWRS